MWLSDLDECSTNTDGCDVNAVCQNTVGSHTCTCKAGYTGNGQTCHGKIRKQNFGRKFFNKTHFLKLQKKKNIKKKQ